MQTALEFHNCIRMFMVYEKVLEAQCHYELVKNQGMNSALGTNFSALIQNERMKKGPIILIDDDRDDCDIAKEALAQTGFDNRVLSFSDAYEAFNALREIIDRETPFIIICDINLPGMNGIELKQKIDKDPMLRPKSIPFIFLSTAGDQTLVREAYECCTVQGFFTKDTKMSTFISNLKTILTYWALARTPE